MKITIKKGHYIFDKTAKTVVLTDYSVVDRDDVMAIINATTNAVIINIAKSGYGCTVTGNVITAVQDTSAMSNTDELLIVYDDKTLINATNDMLETLIENTKDLQVLAALREKDNSLRVSTTNSITIGTLPTLANVTTLGTLTTITNPVPLGLIGGLSPNQLISNFQNQNAIQSNINNVL